MKRVSTLWIGILLGILGALAVATIVMAATIVDGPASYATATVITPGTEYQAVVDAVDTEDRFQFTVGAGQAVTVTIASTAAATWQGTVYFYIYDQNHVSQLWSEAIFGEEQSVQFTYMGNNTTPTKYYLTAEKFDSGSNTFLFNVQVANQNDGGAAGDAGDAVASARTLTPAAGATTVYIANLGYADDYDWFKFAALPGQPITVTATLLEGSGTLYATLRNQAGTQVAGDAMYNPLESVVLLYGSNNSTPTGYQLEFYFGGANVAKYRFEVQLGRQADAGQAGDAGDTSNTARAITPTMGIVNSYDGWFGYTDDYDYYRINVQSGQIITVTFDLVKGTGTLYATLRDQAGVQRGGDALYSESDVPVSLVYMSNNTTPSAYVLEMYCSANDLIYNLKIELGQQRDAGVAGDAGDDFNSARVINLTSQAPVLQASGNILGDADVDDYYLIKLPLVVPPASPTPYRLWVTPESWPTSGGSLSITMYDSQRRAISGETDTLYNPEVAPFVTVLDQCGNAGCYAHIESSSDVKYGIRLAPIYRSYLPVISGRRAGSSLAE